MTSKRAGLWVLGLCMVSLAFGCESHQSGMRHGDSPSQAGSAGQQGTKDGHSPMEHDKGGDRMMK